MQNKAAERRLTWACCWRRRREVTVSWPINASPSQFLSFLHCIFLSSLWSLSTCEFFLCCFFFGFLPYSLLISLSLFFFVMGSFFLFGVPVFSSPLCVVCLVPRFPFFVFFPLISIFIIRELYST